MKFAEIQTDKGTIVEDFNKTSKNNTISEANDNIFDAMQRSYEKELIKEVQKGNKKATEKLIDNLNGYLYAMVRKEIFGEEMIVEGYNCAIVGLLKAIKTFDPNKGYRLMTYARTFIKKEIITFLKFELSITKRKFISKSNNNEIELEFNSINSNSFEIEESYNTATKVIDENFSRVENEILFSDKEGGILKGLMPSEKEIIFKLMNGENITKISEKANGKIDWSKYRKTHKMLSRLRGEVI